MWAYLQQCCMRFTLHRHLHCSWSFLPFPSPNMPLLDLFTCSLCSCSSCMSHGWEGSLFITTTMFPLLLKGSKHEKSCLLITFDCMQWRSLLSVQQTRDWEHFSGSASGQMSTAVTGEYICSEECFLWISLIKTTSLPKGTTMRLNPVITGVWKTAFLVRITSSPAGSAACLLNPTSASRETWMQMLQIQKKKNSLDPVQRAWKQQWLSEG